MKISWIKCQDRLPDNQVDYLLYDDVNDELGIGYYERSDCCFWAKEDVFDATHWAEIERPKK